VVDSTGHIVFVMPRNPFLSSPEPDEPAEQQQSFHQPNHQNLLFPGLFRNNPPVSSPNTPWNTHASTARASSDYMIPGLGMSGGFGSSAASPVYTSKPDPPAMTDDARIQTSEYAMQRGIGEIIDETLEEGELSEGESEDFYEPRAADVSMEEPPPRPLMLPSADRTGSAGDADGSSIYDTGSTRGEVVIDSTSASQPGVEEGEYSPDEYCEPESEARGHSGSYSPHLSPQEAQLPGLVAPGASQAQRKFCRRAL
jgi:hypothetical protein